MGGKSSKQTVGYKYYTGFTLVIAKFIHKLLQIKTGDKVAWSGESTGGAIAIDQPTLYGAAKVEGGIQGIFVFQPGYIDQLPDPYLQQQLGVNISANRGVSQLVGRQPYIGNNPYLKDTTVRGERIHLRDDGSTQWYDATSAIPNVQVLVSQTFANWKYLVVGLSDTTDYSTPSFDDSGWNIGASPFGDRYEPAAEAAGFVGTPATVIPTQRGVWLRSKINCPDNSKDYVLTGWFDNGITVWLNGIQVLTNVSALGHVYTATIAGSNFVNGLNDLAVKLVDVSTSVPGNRIFFSWELQDPTNTTSDMNPAHIALEILTNTEWGYGYDLEDIDLTTFTSSADLFFAERLGLSYFWDDDNTDIEQLMEKVLDHSLAFCYVDTGTLKWTLKPVRNDYDPDTLLELTSGKEVISIDDYDRPEFLDLINTVIVEYYNISNAGSGSLTVPNPALLLQQGVRVSQTSQYDMCCNSSLAGRLGLRDLNILGQPLRTVTVSATNAARNLQLGGTFKLTAPEQGFSQSIMRISSITYGDGKSKKIKIICKDDSFAMPTVAFSIVDPPQWVDPNVLPNPVTKRMLTEVPYGVLLASHPQNDVDSELVSYPDEGYIGASAARVDGTLNAAMYVDSGAGFELGTSVDYCAYGTLSDDLAADPASTATLSLLNGIDLDELSGAGYLQIDDEIIGYSSANTSGLISGLARGAFDTIPALHTVGSPAFFIKDYLDYPSTSYTSGESLGVKLTSTSSKGELPLAAAPTDTVVMANRAIRPYPPANVQVDGETIFQTLDRPDTNIIAITWAHRDRLLQQDQVVGWDQTDIGPEAGVAYDLNVYDPDGIVVDSITDITDNHYTYTASLTEVLTFKLESKRGSYICWQTPVWDVNFGSVISGGLTTPAGVLLTTPDGVILQVP